MNQEAEYLSIVVPVYNESAGIEIFHRELTEVIDELDSDVRIWYVDDGSRDDTADKIRDFIEKDKRVRLLPLSRNYGKEAATTAGLDFANGSAVVLMDGDGQDPPSLIPQMIERWHAGASVVLGVRNRAPDEGFLRKIGSKIFYSLLRRSVRFDIQEGAGDFRLMDREVIQAMRQINERNRYMKGLFAYAGFRCERIEFERPARVAGTSQWSMVSLFRLAIDGLTAFSVAPLRLASFTGLLVSFFALVYGGKVLLQTLVFGEEVAGYPSLMLTLLALGGLILMCLGIIGEYLARIFIETKQRPIYISYAPEGGE